MGKSVYDFAENMIRNNPRFQNDPRAQQALQIIQSRDEKAGIELANHILGTNNLDQKSGIQKAMSFFGFDN